MNGAGTAQWVKFKGLIAGIKKSENSVIVSKNQVRLHFLSKPEFVQRRTKFKGSLDYLWSTPKWYKSWKTIECYEAKILSLANFKRNLPWKFWKQFHNRPLVGLGFKAALATYKPKFLASSSGLFVIQIDLIVSPSAVI